jgi:alcohol dehydrogenase class IV
MLLGALMAGKAFANAPVGAVHALAYPLGGHYNLPHGLSNSLVLVATMQFNLSHATDEYAALADAILPAQGHLTAVARAERFIDAIAALVARMPYTQCLREAGIPESALPTLARDAINVQRLLVNNPREVALADALSIYEAAY